MELLNQIAIISGAARGISREIAVRFACEGARVVVADVDEAGARAVAAEIAAPAVFLASADASFVAGHVFNVDGGFVCTILFGYLVQAFGDYDVPIFFIAATVLLSAWLFWRIDATRPLIDETA